MTKTYLELSSESGTAHKFYEVVVEGCQMTIRYGRIGTDGTRSTKVFSTEALAQKEAQKKIKSKQRKGYEEAVMGVRKKRTISRRSVNSSRSSAKKAPLLWKFNSGSSAFGIYIGDQYCWVGNQSGSVYKLNHEGEVMNQYQLPDGVKCIIGDGDWVYVGCDDGNVYDLTGKLPRKAYEIKEDVDIYWLDINNGLLGVSDGQGGITVINSEDEEQWSKKSSGSSGWMVRCDEVGRIYHGHSDGVSCYYGYDGKNIWNQKTKGSVLFGWRTDDVVLTGSGSGWLELFDKDGKKQGEMKGDSAIYSCAASAGNQFIFGGDSSSSMYCFTEKGDRLWKLATTCGSALSMQYHKEKLFIVTTQGYLACIDASSEAVENAKAGQVPDIKDIKAPEKVAVVDSMQLETAPSGMDGIHLQCIKDGSKLRVRVASDGYHKDWNVQFPKNLRKEGAKYLVEQIRESQQGGFYRVLGDIYIKNN